MAKSFTELRAKACRVFRISKDDFESSRMREAVHARSYVAYYLRKHKKTPWHMLKRLLKRDHATIVYLVRVWPENYQIARRYIRCAHTMEKAAKAGYYVSLSSRPHGMNLDRLAKRLNETHGRVLYRHRTFSIAKKRKEKTIKKTLILWDGTR